MAKTKSNTRPDSQCPMCDGGVMRDAVLRHTAVMRNDGKQHEVVIENLTVRRCEKCAEILFDNRADDQMQDALRRHLGVLMPAEIASRLERWGLRHREVCADTGIAVETLSRWLQGHVIQSKSSDMLLRAYLSNPTAFRKLTTTKPREQTVVAVQARAYSPDHQVGTILHRAPTPTSKAKAKTKARAKAKARPEHDIRSAADDNYAIAA